MKRHLNTLFVSTEGSFLSKDGEAVVVRREGETVLRVPTLSIGGVVCFGNAVLSTPLLGHCAERGVSVSLHSSNGRFLARVEGPTSGNVLLRRAQFRLADDEEACLRIARSVVVGKVLNSRTVLQRAVRDHGDPEGSLGVAIHVLGRCARRVQQAQTLEQLRGVEGEAGKAYFGSFDALITRHETAFCFRGRSRRPPLDPVNALLSFLYGMLVNDVRSACEGTGLDPQVGFLHRDRPGRAGLALDLMEELRSFVADRVALTVINRRQVDEGGFVRSPSGATRMTVDARKAVLVAYQKRKQEELIHPFLREKTTIGLVPHLQARLLARHLRGDLNAYPPFLAK